MFTFFIFFVYFCSLIEYERRNHEIMKQIASHLSLIFLFLILYMSSLMAQDTIPSLSSKPKRPDNFWHRVSVGGNLGFQAGTVTGIALSPEIRIRTIDQLNVGLRFTYQYYYTKNYFLNTKSYLNNKKQLIVTKVN